VPIITDKGLSRKKPLVARRTLFGLPGNKAVTGDSKEGRDSLERGRKRRG
jgi:hypothetical protein